MAHRALSGMVARLLDLWLERWVAAEAQRWLRTLEQGRVVGSVRGMAPRAIATREGLVLDRKTRQLADERVAARAQSKLGVVEEAGVLRRMCLMAGQTVDLRAHRMMACAIESDLQTDVTAVAQLRRLVDKQAAVGGAMRLVAPGAVVAVERLMLCGHR